MIDIVKNIQTINNEVGQNCTLVAVTKTKPNSYIEEAYKVEQRHFGENKVQELERKYNELPKDIKWHMIGHLQTNKVKHIAPFVYLIHSVDSLKLAKEINKQASKNNRIINILLQVHVGKEDSKFGLSIKKMKALINEPEFKSLDHIKIVGLMTMATNTTNQETIKFEFDTVNKLYKELKPSLNLKYLSMGMSSDYKLALSCGSNMIRVGSTIFGERNYKK